MKLADMNWRDVEAYLEHDDRCVLPIGSVEQHAQLSLCVDMILAEKIALEAAEPLKIPVYPVMPYGLAPYFTAYPGTISLRVETLLAVMRDVIASIRRTGFRRVLIVNGHGGNAPVGALAQELMTDYGDLSIKFHGWWNAPKVFAHVQAIDPVASHASWMENFPWTRLDHAKAPDGHKPMVDMDLMRASPPNAVRDLLKDGNFGGDWIKEDAAMLALWRTGVEETRSLLEGPWPLSPAEG